MVAYISLKVFLLWAASNVAFYYFGKSNGHDEGTKKALHGNAEPQNTHRY